MLFIQPNWNVGVNAVGLKS